VRPTRVLSRGEPSEGGWHKGDGGENGEKRRDRGVPEEDASVAPVVGKWAEACFPVGSQTTEEELRELLREAAESAKQDYDAGSAVEWAEGYRFPPEYVESDVRCLQAAQLDFPVMVRGRLTTLAPDRMNAERVSRLRLDNPELPLLKDLVAGMKVHLPVNFTPNGMMPRSPRRPIYETVATAVNKMLEAGVPATAGNGTAIYPELTHMQGSLDSQEGKEVRPPLGGSEQRRWHRD
jgi:hypothetical protein